MSYTMSRGGVLVRKRRMQPVRKARLTPSDAHVNVPLTNISVAFMQRSGFVADQVFPIVPVEQQSNVYYLWNKDDFLRDEARKLAPGAESAGGGADLSTDNYSCTVDAWHYDIDDQLRANADSVLSLDTSFTELCTQKLLIRRERAWMAKFFVTGVWGTDVTGVTSTTPSAGQFTQWSTTGSDPLADVEVGKVTIAGSSGLVPNTMLMGYNVFSTLRNHPKIREQFKYTSAESITQDMMANYFGVSRLFVSTAVFSNGVEGTAGTTAFIGGKNVLLCYSAPSPALMQPTAGYMLMWSGYIGSGGTGLRTLKFRVDKEHSDRVESMMAYDYKRVSAELGYFLSGAVA